MKNLRSHLTYTAFLFVACLSMVACSTLYEPDPSSTPGAVKPRSTVTNVVDAGGTIAGPWGAVAATAINAALALGALVQNRKTQTALANHIESSAPPK